MEEDLEYWLKMQSATINKNTPVMVDEYQRFDGSQAIDDTIVYIFTLVNAIKTESDIEVFAKEMTTHLKAMACPMKGISEILKRGAKIEYKFLDKNTELIFTTTITKELCYE